MAMRRLTSILKSDKKDIEKILAVGGVRAFFCKFLTRQQQPHHYLSSSSS